MYLWDGILIEDDVFIGPAVVFTNDRIPRSKQRIKPVSTRIKQGVSLGANSTILAGVTVGCYAMSGIGSVITKDVPDYALVYGNPASIKGWVDEKGRKLLFEKENLWVSEEGIKYQQHQFGLKRI